MSEIKFPLASSQIMSEWKKTPTWAMLDKYLQNQFPYIDFNKIGDQSLEKVALMSARAEGAREIWNLINILADQRPQIDGESQFISLDETPEK